MCHILYIHSSVDEHLSCLYLLAAINNVAMALLTISRTWKQPRCPLTDERTQKLWYICTMEYYSAIKKNTFELVLMVWMDMTTFNFQVCRLWEHVLEDLYQRRLVLVYLGCWGKVPQALWLINSINLFLTAMEVGNCKIKALAWSCSGEGPLPVSQLSPSSCALTGGRQEGALWGFFYKARIPFT